MKYAENMKILFFHKFILNMNIALIMTLTCLKIVRHVLKTHLEERVSQNCDICLSFNLIAFRRRDFKKNYKKITKVTVFCSKIKTRT